MPTVAPSIAPLPYAVSLLAEARDRACALRDRPPTDPHLVAVEIAAIGDLLEKAIGGPTDPNTPAGG